jgi:hypothetical protein
MMARTGVFAMRTIDWLGFGIGCAWAGAMGCSSDSLDFGATPTTGSGGDAGAGNASQGGGAGDGVGAAGGQAGGAGPTGGSGGAGAGGEGEGGGEEGGKGGEGNADCDALLDDVLEELVKAQQCSVVLPIVQCSTFVDGPCCPVPVADGQSSETANYLKELQDYAAAGCVPTCPPVECDPFPTGSCQPNGQGNLEGTCTEN